MCRYLSYFLRVLLSVAMCSAAKFASASDLCVQCDADDALSMSATYTGEAWRQMSGGLDTGTVYLDNLDLTMDVDAARAFGWRGVEMFAYALYNNGHGLCDRLAGSMQCVSNIEENRAARMFELWGDWSSESKRESLRLGLYDVNSEFDSIEAAQIFINPSQGIGPDLSQSGLNGPSIFPVTSLGLRGKKTWSSIEVKAAVLDAVPGDPDHPDRTTIRLSAKEGALVVAEVDRPAKSADNWRFAAGYWRYTSSFDRFADQATSETKQHTSSGAYAIVESPAFYSAGSDEGMKVYARIGWADPSVNAIQNYWGGGLVYHTEINKLERSVGLAAGIAQLGRPYRTAALMADTETRKREYCYELTARWGLSNRWVLQPDLQFIDHPGMDASLRAGWIAGLRVEVSALGSH
jgi:porin